MPPVHDDIPFERLVQRIAPGSALVRSWSLTGGVSAAVTALELRRPNGTTERLVVRQHGATDRARNPQIARDEFALLERLSAAGIAVPAPVALDAQGEFAHAPALVTVFVEGTAGFTPGSDVLQQFAAQLARLHALDPAQLGLAFLPDQADAVAARLLDQPASLGDSTVEARAWEVLRADWPPAPRNPPRLLHGDFWPGNTLWQAGRLVAIIDWEDAALGDPLADLANSRLELLWAGGADALERFTAYYTALAPLDVGQLPYWDLAAALRPAANLGAWGLEAETERTMRRQLGWFITQALDTLQRG
jgi:aminoglycoside phosphotransferase (APT) family kinase protein